MTRTPRAKDDWLKPTQREASIAQTKSKKGIDQKGEDLESWARSLGRPEVMLCGSLLPGQGFSLLQWMLVTVK
jgi:hypothetical protein